MSDFVLSAGSPYALAESLMHKRLRDELKVRFGAAATQDAWWLLFALLSYFTAYERAKSIAIGLATIESCLHFEFVETLASRHDTYGGLAQDYMERLSGAPREARAQFATHVQIVSQCLHQAREIKAA